MQLQKIVNIALGAALLMTLTTSSVVAASKCGGASEMAKAKGCHCDEGCDNPNCAAKLKEGAACDCDHNATMKCGGEKKAPAMKCGAGRCG